MTQFSSSDIDSNVWRRIQRGGNDAYWPPMAFNDSQQRGWRINANGVMTAPILW